MRTIKTWLATIVVLLCSMTASAWDIEFNGIYYKKTGNGTVGVVYHENYKYKIANPVIPKEVTYISGRYEAKATVTSIEAGAFAGAGIWSITLPESITEIGEGAFRGTNLTSFTFPKKVEKISPHIFEGCGELKSIDLPEWFDKIGAYAFARTAIDSFSIPKRITKIEDGVFEGCSKLQSIDIPSEVTQIGKEAFAGTAIDSFSIPKRIAKIEDGVFKGCSKLQSIDIPSEVTQIGHEAFADCSKLKTITIPSGVTEIGKKAFMGCSGLTSLIIPNGIQNIKNETFANCTSLATIVIPSTLKEITYNAFSGCKQLKTIINFSQLTLEEGSKDNGQIAYYANRIRNVTDGHIENNCVLGAADTVNVLCAYLGNETELVLPANYKGEKYIIDYSVFQNNTNLTTITIPSSVTDIRDRAFYGCKNLKTIYNFSELVLSRRSKSYGEIGYYALRVINAPNGSIENDYVFSVVDGVNILSEYIGNEAELILPANYRGENYTIGNRAFVGYSRLTSVSIPNSVTGIGSSAFYNCSNLSSITLPTNLNKIGSDVFYGCTKLASIEIPDGVTEIGSGAFEGCSSLASVTIPDGVTKINGELFYKCSGLTSVTLPKNLTEIGISAFASCLKLPIIIIPNTVTEIGFSAFDGCYLKTVVNFSNLVFSRDSTNYGLIAYNVPRVINAPNGCVENDYVFGVVDGENKLFGYIGNEKEITLPAYYNGENYMIAPEAFYKHHSLTSVTLPNTVTEISESAFFDCSGLKSVTLSNNITEIGDNAFKECRELASISIPASVKKIGSNAFQNCFGLSGVYINSLESWCNINFGNSFANPICTAKKIYLNDELITSLVIPNGITKISSDLFYNCTSLTSVTIPNSITEIGSGAFGYCTGLTSVTLPNSITKINSSVFSGCSSLTSIEIPESVISIDRYAFSKCSSLVSIAIPNNVTEIGSSAFEDCTGLKSITIPIGVTEIPSNSFRGCSNLVSITLPKKIQRIERNAFSKCTSITDVYCNSSQVPNTDSKAFSSSNIADATLHVSANLLEDYKNTEPWSGFGSFKEIPRYTISFVIDSVEYHCDTLEYGDTIFLPAVPVKEGHTFCGWSEMPKTMPAEDVVITGTFTINKYLVTFKVDGEIVASDSLEYGATIVVPTVSEREGYTFDGWADVDSIVPAYDVTYESSYTVNTYKVYYYVDDELVYTEEVAYGEVIPEYIYEPTTEGAIFVGWIGETYETMPAHDVTYVANIDTGINELKGENGKTHSKTYDLSGRRIKNSYKGLYIVNGKKVLIK